MMAVATCLLAFMGNSVDPGTTQLMSLPSESSALDGNTYQLNMNKFFKAGQRTPLNVDDEMFKNAEFI
jgi:hypothetical protein